MAGQAFTTGSQPFADGALNGGLNSTGGGLHLQDNESSDLSNIDFDKFGAILKRSGYYYLNGTTAGMACDGLYWAEFATSGTTVTTPIYISRGKFKTMDALDGTWDDETGFITITSANFHDFETFNKKIFFTNSVDVPHFWAEGDTAGVAGVPSGLTKAKFVKQFNNYLFYANVTVSNVSYPTRVYFSNLRDDTTWDGADWIEIAKDDGQEITGLKVLSDRLVVFKTRSIYNLYYTGDSDIPFIMPGGGKSNSPVGCIAPWSIQEVENGLVFLSYDGLYYYDGMNSSKLSDKINTTLDGFNRTRFTEARSLVYKKKNRYLLTFCDGSATSTDTIVVWDYYNNAFSIYKGIAASALSTFYVTTTDERPYFADYNGYIYRMDYGETDYPLKTATAINAYYYTNWKHFQDICDQKGIPHIYLYHRLDSTILNLSYSYDFEEGDTYTQTVDLRGGTDLWDVDIWDSAVWGGSGGKCNRRDLTGRGRVVRLKFANATIDEPFKIDGFGSFVHLESNV